MKCVKQMLILTCTHEPFDTLKADEETDSPLTLNKGKRRESDPNINLWWWAPPSQ